MKSILTILFALLILSACGREDSSTASAESAKNYSNGCLYNNVTYAVGAVMPPQDKCNQWVCTAIGVVSSTQIFCN